MEEETQPRDGPFAADEHAQSPFRRGAARVDHLCMKTQDLDLATFGTFVAAADGRISS